MSAGKERVDPQTSVDLLNQIDDVLLETSQQRCAMAVERLLKSAAPSIKRSMQSDVMALDIAYYFLGVDDPEGFVAVNDYCECPVIYVVTYTIDYYGTQVFLGERRVRECEADEPYRSDATGGLMYKPVRAEPTESEEGDGDR